ncbi:hypothetical protein M409DRAFT_54322 [Zasmidium cellare ATCC 36951]|uniref:F-box domain-containing protein n=1 Tax=Zasmidium cellare ATCC 36951 TaxID=1080233 RepID=A0A6A6CMZ1_ZASCE|nr:uncharacterized protein M409DRAFT_54322 [Zasmidium cellare ATCC 36951]KAF2167119.1 hypothetical protein M409DRAFT_54322 [Zasmidium cellare ATCC 36951]
MPNTTTTPPPTFTACNKVWSLPEPRNHILLSLPLRDLRKALLVCRDWSSPSTPMQEVVFLKPRGSHRIDIVPSEDSAENYYNEKGWRDPWMLKLRGRERRCKPVLNPFFPFDDGRVPTNVLFFRQSAAWHSADATWPDELFLQPPAVRVKFVCLGGYLSNALEPPSNEDMDAMYEGVEVVNPSGVTLGEVVVALKGHVNECEDCESWMQAAADQLLWQFHGSREVVGLNSDVTGLEMLRVMREC